jgi:hypothetical protein
MSTRATRATRGAVFAAIATVTAAAAHTIGGGAAPSPLFCAILFAFAVPLTTALVSASPAVSRGPLSRAALSKAALSQAALWRTGLAVGASQALFHAAFAVVGDLGASPVPLAQGHVHGSPSLSLTDAAVHLPTTVLPVGLDMTVAHAFAAVITIALVCRGEAALAAIASWIVRAAAAPLDGPVPPSVPRRVASIPVLPRTARVVPPGLGRRGPPSVLSSFLAA